MGENNQKINIEIELDFSTLVRGGYSGRHRAYDEDGYRMPAESLEDVIADQLVGELLHRIGTKDYPELSERIKQIRDEEIRSFINYQIEAELAKPLQKTNSWGEPEGEPTTLKEIIVKQAEALTTMKLDRNGDRASHTSYGDKKTALEWVVEKEVNSAFRRELETHVKAAKEEITGVVKDRAATVLSETIQRMANQS